MGSQNRILRTLIVQFHATDEELAARVINLIRMMRGQVAVASNYITQADYEQSVKDFRLDSNSTGW
jgi:hypothetical protein